MISPEKWMILAPLQKSPNNKVNNLGKIIVATGFECLPQKQKIAQSGHTAHTVGTLLGLVASLSNLSQSRSQF